MELPAYFCVQPLLSVACRFIINSLVTKCSTLQSPCLEDSLLRGCHLPAQEETTEANDSGSVGRVHTHFRSSQNGASVWSVYPYPHHRGCRGTLSCLVQALILWVGEQERELNSRSCPC